MGPKLPQPTCKPSASVLGSRHLSCTRSWPSAEPAVDAALEACVHAVQTARHRSVTLVSDCKSAIQVVQDAGGDRPLLGRRSTDILKRLREHWVPGAVCLGPFTWEAPSQLAGAPRLFGIRSSEMERDC